MSDDKNSKPGHVDRKCIEEALRRYLEPIKYDDPKLDFYTMYKREALEYDTQYMDRHNEDLNTTLIFAGLFSAVSSAFIVYIQPQLQPDSGDRSEAYLRAILLTLNPSLFPNEEPSAPPTWNGPPSEIITTSGLLYASLLMSLLTAFVAMLGKQWLTRYLRRTGGSIFERCGNRQGKSDGLEKWPFHFFIESLPVMLQIALLLLACALSRYTWSVNTSVGWVLISFTAFGFLLYIGLVLAGASSDECPFQAPGSMALRRLTVRNFTLLIYATWTGVRGIWRNLGYMWRNLGYIWRNLGYRAFTLLLWIDGSFRDAKEWITQNIRSIKREETLPTTLPTPRDTNDPKLTPRNGPRDPVSVQDLEALRSQNTTDARCVPWVLRRITDPEAIDSAIRLAGDIRWFDGDHTNTPRYDLIVPIFEACFDPTNQLNPGMRNRAYFSARAILQIKMRARAQPHDDAYPVPTIHPNTYEKTDSDLHNILYMLEQNFVKDKPTLHFPSPDRSTHSLWMTNLFVDSICLHPNPTLEGYESYLSTATADHRASIANILLMWCILLGGQVPEETLWVVDKSNSLKPILSYLSERVTSTITDGTCIHHLNLLLEFLAAWEERPEYLTRMVCQWSSALSGAVGRLRPDETRIEPPQDLRRCEENNLRLRPHDMEAESEYPGIRAALFSAVRTNRDSGRSDATHSRVQHSLPEDLYGYLLFIMLEVGFRRVGIDARFGGNHLDDTYQELIFDTAFSSDDDEVVADAVRMWITSTSHAPLRSFAQRFTKRLERVKPLSEELQKLVIRVVGRIWSYPQARGSERETVRLLNRLDADEDGWVVPLVDVMGDPDGLELSLHYWRLVDKVVDGKKYPGFGSSDWEMMGALWEAEDVDWEKLEVSMSVKWKLLQQRTEVTEDIRRVTRELLSQRPSALQKFEKICGGESSDREEESNNDPKRELRKICKEARDENLTRLPQLAPTQQLIPLILAGDGSF